MEDSPSSQNSEIDGASSPPTEQMSIIAQQMSYSGPLPPSSEMRKYDEITPGAADRILAMAEKEQAHRHASEVKENDVNERIADSDVRAQEANINEIHRGQWMAFGLGLAFLGVTALFGLKGHEFAASALGLSGVAAVATVFIKVRNKQ